MKYCPNCRAEYHDDVVECHDCRVPLVDELPEELPEEWEHIEPVVIHRAATVIDAELIVGTLRANDVRVFAAGTGAELYTEAGQIGQITGIPGPLNEIRIMVHPEDEERAREVLAGVDEQVPDPEDLLTPSKWNLDAQRRRTAIRVVAVIILAPIIWVFVMGLMDLVRNL